MNTRLQKLLWPTGLVAAALVSFGCASTAQPRWVSGVCGTSAAFRGEVSANVDITPQNAGGTHYNLEIKVSSPERGAMGFGCDLLPSSIRAGFSGLGLSDNAISALTGAGYAPSKDVQSELPPLKQRSLVLEKKGESPFHVVYRWPDNHEALHRAFWHQGKAVKKDEIAEFFGTWTRGWDFYRPWQTIGIGECAAQFGFPAKPQCEFVAGTDNFVTRCAASSGEGAARFVVECMIQQANTEENEAATFQALDRGLMLATKRPFGNGILLDAAFTESARSAVPNLWVKGRRHTLRSGDGSQHREALIAARRATIYAMWVEWQGEIAPSAGSVQRFFDSFRE